MAFQVYHCKIPCSRDCGRDGMPVEADHIPPFHMGCHGKLREASMIERLMALLPVYLMNFRVMPNCVLMGEEQMFQTYREINGPDSLPKDVQYTHIKLDIVVDEVEYPVRAVPAQRFLGWALVLQEDMPEGEGD